MKGRRPLGLDELMIVNPGPTGSGAVFLGADGILYGVQGLDQEEEPTGMGQWFLGEDGTLYQVQGLGRGARSVTNRCFLGEDGTLYEIVR
jgi:hypothetical protein